jgi:hypothetical protein
MDERDDEMRCCFTFGYDRFRHGPIDGYHRGYGLGDVAFIYLLILSTTISTSINHLELASC